jgi:c-di-GMP-binding flagellar brake protein YcgR
MCFSLAATIVETLLKPRKLLFNVTPKEQKFTKSEMDMADTIPHLFILALLSLGMILGVYSFISGTGNRDALLVSLVLGSYNLLLLICAIFAAKEGIQKRGSFRLERRIPCELIFGHQKVTLQTSDISETGLGLNLDRPTFLPHRVAIRLEHGGEWLETQGVVVHNDMAHSGTNPIGIKFDSLATQEEQKLIRMMYSISEDWRVNEKVAEGFGDSFVQLLTSPLKSSAKLNKLKRTQPRIRVSLSCDLQLNGRTFKGSVRDISSRGVRITAPKGDWPTRGILSIKVSYQDQTLVSGLGQLVWKKRLLNKDMAGIRWIEDQPMLYQTWSSLQ